MHDVTRSDDIEQPVFPAGQGETVSPSKKNRSNKLIAVISIAIFLLLAALAAAFRGGLYDPLYIAAIISLVGLPVTLIGGAIFCGIKGKWIPFGLAFVILPPAWAITFLGCISDYPWDPSHRLGHAAVLISGAFACWLFLTLTFWQGRSNPTVAQETGDTKRNESTGAGQNNTYGIVALVAGIVGLLFSYIFSLGLIPAILALIFGIQARKRGQKYAAAGINLGIIGTVVNILVSIMLAIFATLYA